MRWLQAPGHVVRRALWALTGSVLALAGMAALAHATGVVLNTTDSLPLGLYRSIDTPVVRGAYVKFCPPPSALFDEAARRGYVHAGFCPGGYGPLLKRVLAAEGDWVEVQVAGVRVNGEVVPRSAPVQRDGTGRALPRYAQSRILTRSELLLMSDVNAMSFDARYFGPVDRQHVLAVIEPLLTWAPAAIAAAGR